MSQHYYVFGANSATQNANISVITINFSASGLQCKLADDRKPLGSILTHPSVSFVQK